MLLRNDLGHDVELNLTKGPQVHRAAQNSMSVKEAVRIAQGNNFMGLVCNLRLLVSTARPDIFNQLLLTVFAAACARTC